MWVLRILAVALFSLVFSGVVFAGDIGPIEGEVKEKIANFTMLPVLMFDDNNEHNILLELTPGGRFEGEFVVFNSGDFDLEFELGGVDIKYNGSGDIGFEGLEEPKDGVGAWIGVEVTEVRIDAGDGKILDFIINVPLEAEYGEYKGGLVAAGKIAEDLLDGGIGVVSRFVLPVNLNIVEEAVVTDFERNPAVEKKFPYMIYGARVLILLIVIAMTIIIISQFRKGRGGNK